MKAKWSSQYFGHIMLIILCSEFLQSNDQELIHSKAYFPYMLIRIAKLLVKWALTHMTHFLKGIQMRFKAKVLLKFSNGFSKT